MRVELWALFGGIALVSLVALGQQPRLATVRTAPAPRAIIGNRSATALKPSHVRRCLRDRWVVFVGDSVARGIFFDLLDLAAGTPATERSFAPHPGHAADFADGCLQARLSGSLNRTRCALWDYALCHAPAAARSAEDARMRLHAPPPPPDVGPHSWRVCEPGGGELGCAEGARAARAGFERAGAPAGCGNVRAPAAAASECAVGLATGLRLSYYAKAFVAEPCYDGALLAALARADAPPDALVFGAGLWDMLYPPRGRADGPAAYAADVAALLSAARAQPRLRHAVLGWLEVTAIAERALPRFKLGRMSSVKAAALNAAARPALDAAGVRVVRLFAPTAVAAAHSPDGVHYPRLRELAALTLESLCASEAGEWRATKEGSVAGSATRRRTRDETRNNTAPSASAEYEPL
jgi:hypothetical protein